MGDATCVVLSTLMSASMWSRSAETSPPGFQRVGAPRRRGSSRFCAPDATRSLMQSGLTMAARKRRS